jgi:hypothetical protein
LERLSPRKLDPGLLEHRRLLPRAVISRGARVLGF